MLDYRDILIDELVWVIDHPAHPTAAVIVRRARDHVEEWHRRRQREQTDCNGVTT